MNPETSLHAKSTAAAKITYHRYHLTAHAGLLRLQLQKALNQFDSKVECRASIAPSSLTARLH